MQDLIPAEVGAPLCGGRVEGSRSEPASSHMTCIWLKEWPSLRKSCYKLVGLPRLNCELFGGGWLHEEGVYQPRIATHEPPPTRFGALPIPTQPVPGLHPILQMAGDVVPVSLGNRPLDKQPCSCVLYARMHKDLVFKALADPTRRLILDELSERKEQTLYELTARLIMRHEVAISRQALAKHIDVLEKAGLVSSEKRGKYRMLVFNDEPLRTVMSRWLK